MYGIFCFENLQKLVYHACDEELLGLITQSLQRRSSGCSSDLNRDDNWKNDSVEDISYFFTPLLASHMFLASELSDGFRIMEGTNNIHLLFFRVMELTCILASTLPFHYVTFLGLTIKRLFRMGFVSFHSNIFLDDGDQDPADEYWLIKNAVKNLERFAKEEPTCIFQLAEHVFLPESIVESCESALKKILNLDPFKYSIEEINLYCMGKVITAHSHHRIDSENTIDFQDATLLSMLLDFSSSSVSEYSSAGNNVIHLEDKDSTSPSSSCANSSSGSFAPLPSSDTVNFKSIPSISVMPNWSSFYAALPPQ
ncbi:uncharacterized protein LOC129601768 isoform X2 [Paramacrobiotus metropolitanus]|uniref:uncharacterized protein LOC129601768 isoform X2 n=1 Tax=Paramacrobiotus metropolitanus TaxID=2943436 RepID=UPI002445CF9D|nr:uncharacterized protein LOC129601768 isoform X2 [Paramacrobiotus metropolitanus]